MEKGLVNDCGGPVRAVVRGAVDPSVTGRRVRASATWMGPAPGRRARESGLLVIRKVETPAGPGWGLRSWHLVVRGRVQQRLRELFGPDAGALAEALVLARKEALDPDVKEAFAVAGLAHLLAISGFHVGVVAGILFGILRLAGVARVRAGVLSAGGCWLYVLGIGVPDAAARAATILTLLAIGRLRGQAVAPAGALATAFLLLTVLNPGVLSAPGFQLSFAGAAGLVFLRPGLVRCLDRGRASRLPRWLRVGLASGTAATLATLPLVAWHFDRISLVGIPATLALAPVVALAIPGIGLSLLLSWSAAPLGRFLAGGVALLLEASARGAELVARVPWASLWVPRPDLLWAGGGLVVGALLLAGTYRVRSLVRRTALVAAVVTGVVLGPVVADVRGEHALQLVFLDVGQGDAMALRSPEGRWLVVDAGPKGETFDAGAAVVAPYLRRHGARRLETLFLTHPDLDHIGGAEALLEAFPVGSVADPGFPAGKEAYVSLLARARSRSVPWWRAHAGEGLDFDGVSVRVLHPLRELPDGEVGANDLSLVLLVRYGEFRALLMGDAPLSVEDAVLRSSPPSDVDLLKVGHHGSSTSTGEPLLERVRPEVAIVSVGRRNRYGHPSGSVLRRLRRNGVRILRTDRSGTVVVRAQRDGSWAVETR